MFRKLLWFSAVIVLLLVLVAGAALFLIFRSKDELVRVGAEKSLAYALDVPATVQSASLDLGAQAVELRGIRIPNPEGFSNDTAIAFGVVRAEVDVASFTTDKRLIKLIRVGEADVLLERSLKTSNLQALIDNASRLSRQDETQPAPTEDASRATMVIERLLVEHTTVRVKLAGMDAVAGDKAAAKLKLADLEMRNVGGDGEQVTPAQALERFLALLLESIRRTGTGVLPDDLIASIDTTLDGLPKDVLGDAQEAARKVTGEIQDAAGNVLKTGEKAVEGVKDAVGGVTGKIGGLLGGDKKKADSEP